jgi:hypothetical protein
MEKQASIFDFIQMGDVESAESSEIIITEPTVKKVKISKYNAIKDINFLENVDPKSLIAPSEMLSREHVWGFNHKNTNGELHISKIDTPGAIKKVNEVREILIKQIGIDRYNAYELPTHPTKKGHFVIPVSGGADSTCTALIMLSKFPEESFVFCFTDTMAEPQSLYNQFDKLESWFGITVNRIAPDFGYYEAIEEKNGYMPSPKNRWCTGDLKIKPLIEFLKINFDLDNEVMFNFVGIRADEDRIGMQAEDYGIITEMPMMYMGLDKNDVFSFLDKTIGIPDFYSWKTRSGCVGCFFLSKREKIAQLREATNEFEFVKWKEKLTSDDVSKYGFYWHQEYRDALFNPKIHSRYANSRLQYFIPDFVDMRKRNGDNFAMISPQNKVKERMFVAVAHYTPRYSLCGDNHGVYKTEVVSYSTVKHGLEKQIKNWYLHKVRNHIVEGFETVDALSDSISLCIFEVEMNADLGQTIKSKPGVGSFTNTYGESYAQIEAVLQIMHTLLSFEGTKQACIDYGDNMPEEGLETYLWSRKENDSFYLRKDFERQSKLVSTLGLQLRESTKFKTPDTIALSQFKAETVLEDTLCYCGK